MAKLILTHPDQMLDDGGVIAATVTLSERNLLTLLSKLYTQGSAAMIANNNIHLDGAPMDPSIHFYIAAETDENHYADESRNDGPAGEMHPVTEVFVAILEDLTQGNFEYDNDGQGVLYIAKEYVDRIQGGL